MEDWNKKTVAILKAECTKRGLETSGKKNVLVERLVKHEENALLADEAADDMETTDTKPDTKDDSDEAPVEINMEVSDSPTKQENKNLITKPPPINIPYKKDVSTEIMRESRVRMVALGPINLEMLKEERIHEFLKRGETFSVNFHAADEPGHCQVRMKSYEAAKDLVEEHTQVPFAENAKAKQLFYDNTNTGVGFDIEGGHGINYGQSRDTRVLYCHGLPEDMTEVDLADLVPEAWIVYILKNFNKKSKGCGYLEFKDPQSMKEYIDASETIPYGDKEISLHTIPRTTAERKKLMEEKKSTVKVPIKKVMSDDIFKETHEREVVCGPLELDDLKNEKFMEVLGKALCFNIRFHTEAAPGHVQMRFVSSDEASEIEKEMKADPFKTDLIVKKLSNEMDFLTRTVGQNAKINAVLRGEKENPLEYLEDRVLYVHNLPDSATENDLKSLQPEPQGVYIIKSDDRTPKGYGFFEFQTSANMRAFSNAIKHFELDGHKVELFNIPKISSLKKEPASELIKVPTRREAHAEVIKEGNDREIAFGPIGVEDLQMAEVKQIMKKSEGFSAWFYGDSKPGHVQVRMRTYAEAEATVKELTETPFKEDLKVKMIGPMLHAHEKGCGYSGRTAGRSEKISNYLQSDDIEEKAVEPLESRLLYLHNLPISATEEHLQQMFPEAAIACVAKDEEREPKGHGYLEFKAVADLQEFFKKVSKSKKVYALDNQMISFHLIPGTTASTTPVKLQQSPANKMRKMDNSGQFNRFQNNQRWGGNQQGSFRGNQTQRGGFGRPQFGGRGGFKRPESNFSNQMGGFGGNQQMGYANQGMGMAGNQGMGFGNQAMSIGGSQAATFGGLGANQGAGIGGMTGGRSQPADAVNLIVELGQILSRQSVSNQAQNQPMAAQQQATVTANQGYYGFQNRSNQGMQSRGFGNNNQTSFNSNQSGYGGQAKNQDRWNRKRKASFSSNLSSFDGQGKMQRQGQNSGGRFTQHRWNQY